MKEFVVRPGAKGRVCLGKLARGVSSYRAIFDEKSHKIILEPYSEIPYGIISPMEKIREGWEKSCQEIAQNNEDILLDIGSIANEGDEEWEW